jgi:hypothetical protein
MSRFRRPTHGTIAAYVALFVALGGTSYAVTALPKNSVGATQIKANAVTGSKVKNGSLSASDFRASSLPKGATGPAGPAGPAGAAGSAAAAGARAYGRVDANGVLSKSKNIASVTHPTVGTYCITPAASANIDTTQTGLVATFDSFGGYVPDQVANVEFDSLGRDCIVGSLEVRVFANGTGTGTRLVHILADGPFFFTIP